MSPTGCAVRTAELFLQGRKGGTIPPWPGEKSLYGAKLFRRRSYSSAVRTADVLLVYHHQCSESHA